MFFKVYFQINSSGNDKFHDRNASFGAFPPMKSMREVHRSIGVKDVMFAFWETADRLLNKETVS